MSKRIVVLVILLSLWPSSLAPSPAASTVEQWPRVIMEAGSYYYVIEEPGGEIICLNNKHFDGKEETNGKMYL